jgi:hypothetical protein
VLEVLRVDPPELARGRRRAATMTATAGTDAILQTGRNPRNYDRLWIPSEPIRIPENVLLVRAARVGWRDLVDVTDHNRWETRRRA